MKNVCRNYDIVVTCTDEDSSSLKKTEFKINDQDMVVVISKMIAHVMLSVCLLATVHLLADEKFAVQRTRTMEACKSDIDSHCHNRTHKMNCLVEYRKNLSQPCLQYMKTTELFGCMDEVFTYCRDDMSYGRRKVLWCLYETLIRNASSTMNVSSHSQCVNVLKKYNFVDDKEATIVEVDPLGYQSSQLQSSEVSANHVRTAHVSEIPAVQASIINSLQNYIFVSNSNSAVSYSLRIILLCFLSVTVGFGLASCVGVSLNKTMQILTKYEALPDELLPET